MIWVIHLDQTRLREKYSEELWDWGDFSRSRKDDLRDLLSDFSMSRAAVVEPEVCVQGFAWRRYVEWVRGDMPLVLDWTPMHDVEHFRGMAGNVRLSDESTVAFGPSWATHGCLVRREPTVVCVRHSHFQHERVEGGAPAGRPTRERAPSRAHPGPSVDRGGSLLA